ncbi:MAG: hypothetical protein IPJ65_07725 [Archangiaceae bacterium]|nr:hypothetical protein [Archangiaceae bacterium]
MNTRPLISLALLGALIACGAPPAESEDDAGTVLPEDGGNDIPESQFDGGDVPPDVPDDGGTPGEEPDASVPEDDAGVPDAGRSDAGPFDAGVRDAGVRDAGTPAPVCVEYTTRHLQASMQKTDTVAQKNQSIDKAFLNPDGVAPDTISWTEIETQSQVDHINAKAGWKTYWPSNPTNPGANPPNYVPISWRTAVYSFIGGASSKSSDGKVGVTPDLYVTRVRLKHLASGTEVQRVAIHAVAGIDTLNDNVAYRIATHAKNITSFNNAMKAAPTPVIGSGDFNTTRLPTMLKDENNGTQIYLFDTPSSGGSLGNRLIDWVVHKKSDGVRYVFGASSFVDLSPTDHKGVRSRFTYRPPPCK